METTSNSERGLISLPVELTTEILDYFPDIGPYTAVRLRTLDNSILLELYLVRIDIFRALSQVCVAYRRVFLPLLWNSLNICFRMRRANPKWSKAFYKHVGQAVIRKCEGLSANPDLASYIGTVRVVMMPYERPVLIPTLSTCLSSLQNLHTFHVVGTTLNLTSEIESGFQGVVLPRIRTLIIPGDCHEILKCCPQVTKVWCNRDNGSQLVAVIAKYCKEVEEMRGFLADEEFIKRDIPADETLVKSTFLADERLVKRIIKAAPNLRVLDMNDRNFLPIINALQYFKNINTIIIKASGSDIDLNKCINATKQGLKDLGPSNERRYIRTWHRSNDFELRRACRTGSEIDERDTNAYIRGYYTEVQI